MNSDLSIDDEWRALQDQFAAKLPGRIQELANAITKAQANPAYAHEARSLAHRLRGTAGSYGFLAVGVASGVIEDLLVEAITTSGVLRPSFWTEVQSALENTRQAMLDRLSGK